MFDIIDKSNELLKVKKFL